MREEQIHLRLLEIRLLEGIGEKLEPFVGRCVEWSHTLLEEAADGAADTAWIAVQRSDHADGVIHTQGPRSLSISRAAEPYRAVAGVTTPTDRVRPDTRARAAGFGRQPSSSAAAGARPRASRDTQASWSTAPNTVFCDKPDHRATSMPLGVPELPAHPCVRVMVSPGGCCFDRGNLV
ncbi:hypothetical protein ACFW93_30445 [Streptomyces canus]|uniref:hypothetical protein n=1 Tax=Streptomyces canus TaxID=58343 RepID=UPI0036B1F4A6